MRKSLLVSVALCAGLAVGGAGLGGRGDAGHGTGAVGRRPFAAGLRRRGRSGAPERGRGPGGRFDRRAGGQGRRPRQGRPDAGPHRRPRCRTDRQRQRCAGPFGPGAAGRGQQGLRAPEAALRQAVHQPGRAGACRVAVQGLAGPGCGAAGAGQRHAHAVGPARRARALCRRGGRSARGPGRHGLAGQAAADAVRTGRIAR